MPAPRKRSPEVEAAAMSALLAGQSIAHVAKEYSLPVSTVSRWKREALAKAEGAVTGSSGYKKEIGTLLLEYLAASLTALRAQAEVFSDPQWLRTQEASQLAVLHGVQTDKAVRLLEALNPQDEDDEE